MIVIGADTHKSTHTLAAVQAETGRIVATKTVDADAVGMLRAWRWSHTLEGGERVWALEDCRHVSGRLERCLVGQGEQVVRVAPKLMGATRRSERRPIAALRPDVLTQHGIGTITAATLIGHTAGAARFPTDGHFARLAGAAPIPASSGRTKRVRLNRGGDRQLNCALHRIAVTRARTCPHTRAYLDRKLGEGKTNAEAYRCLKRHLARQVWHLLTTTPTPDPNDPERL